VIIKMKLYIDIYVKHHFLRLNAKFIYVKCTFCIESLFVKGFS